MQLKPRHDLKEPRSWWDLFLRLKGWIAMIAGVVLLFFTVISVINYINAERLTTEGIWTDALVQEAWIERGDENDSYLIRFAYDVDGTAYVAKRSVKRSYFYSHSEGSQTQIKYWPENPSLMEHVEGDTRGGAIALQIAALMAGLLACGMLWWSGGKAAKGVLSRKHGVRTTAKILRIVEYKNSGKPTGRGHMVFRTENGVEGESLTHRTRKLKALGIGSEIVVFERGKDVWWEGDVGPRAEHDSDLPEVTP